jgi:hypothetical protein
VSITKHIHRTDKGRDETKHEKVKRNEERRTNSNKQRGRNGNGRRFVFADVQTYLTIQKLLFGSLLTVMGVRSTLSLINVV